MIDVKQRNGSLGGSQDFKGCDLRQLVSGPDTVGLLEGSLPQAGYDPMF